MTAAETVERGDARTAHEFLLVQFEALPPAVERDARQRILVRHAPVIIPADGGETVICAHCAPQRGRRWRQDRCHICRGRIEAWPCPDYTDAATGLAGDL